MFNNLINIHDFSRVFEKLTQRPGAFLKRILGGKKHRVRESWAHIQSPPTQWYDIPLVKERLNRLVSGDPHIDHRQYILARHLEGKSGLIALSPGCGTGANELGWAETGVFARIDACDLSPNRIQEASRMAGQKGLSQVLNFFTADAHGLSPQPGTYDVVMFEGSLHHIDRVHEMLARVKDWLKPGGLLVVRDFVGPSRFQWSERQLQVANGLLALIPPALRTQWKTGELKKKIFAPSRLRLRLADPSEAVDSASIIPALEEQFRVLEMKAMGGTILQLLFSDIAHHFCGDNPIARDLFDRCCAIEDLLLTINDIHSDFILAVCAPGGTD